MQKLSRRAVRQKVATYPILLRRSPSISRATPGAVVVDIQGETPLRMCHAMMVVERRKVKKHESDFLLRH